MFETLISSEELAQSLDDHDVVVIDCRNSVTDKTLGRKLYGQGHIPGAFFADGEADLSGAKNATTGRHPLPKADTFAAYLRGLGVRETTQVIAYDAGADMFASRCWFLCKWIGHKAVSVLDGGFGAWVAAGYPVGDSLPEARAEGTVKPHLRRDLVVSAEEVLVSLPAADIQLLDARSADRFAGQNETMDPIAGHIPGARNRFFKDNFDEHGKFKPSAVLRKEFESMGVPPERIVHQCGSGISAAVNFLAMERAGLVASRLYAGSWSEWITDPSRPVTTKA
ncbi:MAG: sulfurtransferase [Candidatus Eremiobacteraeota bacterium]|nr:sulfurtransferase [Candidatus Eremiobacteraeota bacterium]